ncbi:hypothetical protein H7691_12345 [Stenotrophomonas sp. CW117]|uniref:hypothetical protein n=1 Tax=Stenotrophomonas TaxID=40323 RepID=UPI00128F7FBA|nr:MULTISPECIES: hypothetical protein [Stenotrophomonas]QOF97427.1 hypothetical protein H7691_12345 [Stenotrophomonas sp. CW117]
MLTEFDCPLKTYGNVVRVVAPLRAEVEGELARIGAEAEWCRSVGGIEPHSDHGDPTAAVAVWSAIVPESSAMDEIKAWIDRRNGTSAHPFGRAN